MLDYQPFGCSLHQQYTPGGAFEARNRRFIFPVFSAFYTPLIGSGVVMKPKKTLSEQQSAMQKRLARNQQQSYLRKREQRLIYARAHNLEVKAEVLTHYGWDGTLRCCWDGCSVNDVDMLTLDHTADDGAQKRASGEGNGQGLYKKLR